MRYLIKSGTLFLVSLLLLLVSGAGPAVAVPAATFDLRTDTPPQDAPPRSSVPMKQKNVCATSAVLPDSQFSSIPANVAFGVNELHRYSQGKGQTVAIIDSGVTPNVRLPRLTGGGDYIMGGNGLSDCDHHGTLLAGIVGAQKARNDSFVGVAPDARLISIRQTSAQFGPVNAQESPASSLETLSKAIVHAANMDGVTVINMSVTACVPATAKADLSALKGALYYAAVVKDIVVVASAGNTSSSGSCTANPLPDPADPADPRGWSKVQTVSLPSYIDQFVLSTAGTTLTGDPYINTLGGPWVDVSAPAINIVSLDPVNGSRGGLINAEIGSDGKTIPLSGTSFAAAYVAGLAALVRDLYPDLTAYQVRNRIINSGHRPATGMRNLLGEAVVDPVAALTGDYPTGPPAPQGVPSRPVAAPDVQDGPLPLGRIVAGVFLGLMVVALIVGGIITWVRSLGPKGGR